jgi:hypothetical protein
MSEAPPPMTIRPLDTLNNRFSGKIVFVHEGEPGRRFYLDSPRGRHAVHTYMLAASVSDRPTQIAPFEIKTAPTRCLGWCYDYEMTVQPPPSHRRNE